MEYLFQQGEISKGTFRKGSHLKIMDSNGVQCVEADLLDHHAIHEAMEGVDTVYNMASPMPDVDTDFMKINTEGLLNLLEVATEVGVKTFIHLSTLDVYGSSTEKITGSSSLKPVGEYQRAKSEAERVLFESSKRSSLPRVVVVRPARAIGPRDTSLTIPLIRMIEAGKVVLPETRVMSFSHPRDIAQAMYRAATGGIGSGSVVLVKSFDTSPGALARGLTTSLGKHAEVRKEGLFSKSSLPPYTLRQLKAALSIDAQPGWTELGFRPEFRLETTCDEIAKWVRKEPWAIDAA